MNRPILHLKKKQPPDPTVTTVTVSGIKPAPGATPAPPPGAADANDANPPPLTIAILLERFPACFNFERPRPLKIGIHKDLAALGYPIKAVRIALSRYCTRPSYRRALVVDAVRVDLNGQDAGRVTKEEVEGAKQAMPTAPKPAPRPAIKPAANSIKLEGESVVIGKIEMVCKFSELPKAVQVQGGYRFAVEQDGVQVAITLNPKAWKKVEQAAKDWPQWIAMVSGKIGAVLDGGKVIELTGAAVQMFERKQKEAAA